MSSENDLLASLSVPAYTTDVEGKITSYNEAAAAFWGLRPEIGESKWCGSWRLYHPEGASLSHHDSALAVTLRTGRPVVGAEAVAERPDGHRVPYMPYPNLLRNAAGEVIGGVNVLIDLSDRHATHLGQERLAAIVSSSDDVIISKTLDGNITSWNAAATRILGYDEAEMIGRSILTVIPPELAHEEAEFLARIRRGQRIEHFDTERLTKDGRRVHLSLTVSPLRDRTGVIIGASKVARDITERKRHEALQKLLINELNHRVKNTLATIQAIAAQSLRRSASPGEFVDSFSGRVQALARAHDLLVRGEMEEARVAEIIEEQVTLGQSDLRIILAGQDVRLEPQRATQLALVLHELATNARKYGALSHPGGTLSITWSVTAAPKPELVVAWREGGMTGLAAPGNIGFGSVLIEQGLSASGGSTEVTYHGTGLSCQIRLPLSVPEQRKLKEPSMPDLQESDTPEPTGRDALHGRKILIVEDEPLLALDICDQLEDEGMVVVGPGRTLAQALQLAQAGGFEIALIDANLNGERVDKLASLLSSRGVPFAFCTGYGPDALPASHPGHPVLPKPFSPHNLVEMVRSLSEAVGSAG